jgi:hypothetical protein
MNDMRKKLIKVLMLNDDSKCEMSETRCIVLFNESEGKAYKIMVWPGIFAERGIRSARPTLGVC